MTRFSRPLVVVAITLGVLGIGPSSQAAGVIQPGVSIKTGEGYCTLNWIYDGAGPQAGKVFAGTARHCVSGVGQRVSLSTTSLGTSLGGFGSVAYVSHALDYSLIEIDTAHLASVNPAVAGHPSIPSGVSVGARAKVGDVMQFSGHGVGFNLTSATQQERMGILGYNDGRHHYIYGPVTPGDSGGPVADVTDGNKAFGIVDTVGVAATPAPQAGEGGVSLDGLLKDAAKHGFPVTVRTV
jgi:hypothetical protein